LWLWESIACGGGFGALGAIPEALQFRAGDIGQRSGVLAGGAIAHSIGSTAVSRGGGGGGTILRFAAEASVGFHPAETARKFAIGFLEGDFGVYAEEAGNVNGGEEQVARFIFELGGNRTEVRGDKSRGRGGVASSDSALPRSRGSPQRFHRAGGDDSGLKFGALFANLVENVLRASPVKANVSGAASEFGSLEESGQTARDSVEQGRRGTGRGVLRAGGLAFRGFQLLPVAENVGGVANASIAKNVGMAANHFVVDALDDVSNIELAGFTGHQGVKDNLQKKVAQFSREIGGSAGIEGVENLIGFLDEKGAQSLGSLLAIPRTAVGSAEAGLEADKFIEQRAGSAPCSLRKRAGRLAARSALPSRGSVGRFRAGRGRAVALLFLSHLESIPWVRH
jgi:hypothetical protein